MIKNALLNIISHQPFTKDLWDSGEELKLFFNENPFINIDDTDPNGQTALSIACAKPFCMPVVGLNLVDMFIRMGADINAMDSQGFTPVMHALVSYEDKELREMEGIRLSQMYNNRHNLFHLLAAEPILSLSENDENIFSLTTNKKLSDFFYEFENIRIERLEDNRHHTKFNNRERMNRQWMKLYRAVFSHNLNDIKTIIKKNPEIVHMKSKRHESFLHYAIAANCEYIVDYLLDFGIESTSQDCRGVTPFIWACEFGNIDIALKFSNDLTTKTSFDHYALDYFIDGLDKGPQNYCNIDFQKWWDVIQKSTDPLDHDGIKKRIIEGSWNNPFVFKTMLNAIGDTWCYDEILEEKFAYFDILGEPHATNIKNLLQNGHEINFGDSAILVNINALYDKLIPQVQKGKFLDMLGEENEEQKRRKI